MRKRVQFRPNYSALYPGVEIGGEMLGYLKKNDMRMEYLEYHRKRERVKRDAEGNITAVLPSLEDSFERIEETGRIFPSDSPAPEQELFGKAAIEEVRRCITLLNKDERALVQALFYDGLTEQEYASSIGITQQAVSKRRGKTLGKIKSLMNF